MPYVLTHDSVQEAEITDTRRQTQTSALKRWLFLVKEKKKHKIKQATDYVGRRRYFQIFLSTNAVPGEYSVKMRGNKQRSLLLLNSFGILSQMKTLPFGLGIARDLLVTIHMICFLI
jgi:hypothetical protein